MDTLKSWHNDATKQLLAQNIDTARLDASLILQSQLKKSQEWIISHDDENLPSEVVRLLNKKLAQRIKRTPLAYIFGCKEFYGHSFIVDENVLIPRPESEVMIEMLAGLLNNTADLVNKKQLDVLSGTKRQLDPLIVSEDDRQGARYVADFELPTIFDVGTGSGCLAISAALLLPSAHVIASDISEDALAVARANAKKHGVNIRFHQSDLLTKVPPMPSTRPYIILANLPYVPDGLITSPEITKEPAGALFSGSEGLDHYKRLWNQIAQLKNKPFLLITESLKNQHKDMEKMAKKTGYNITRKDGLVQVFNL